MASAQDRLCILDGWRATSILLVLATHLLPLGPKYLRLNETTGPMGMSIFFTLSGFLITRSLFGGMGVGQFVIRRLARIVPLAWLAMALLILCFQNPVGAILPNVLFIANLPPNRLLENGGHFWSLCVEMQFYLLAAIVALSPDRRALYMFPLIGLALTLLRIADSVPISIVTWFRADEILAGATLALVRETISLGWLRSAIARLNFYPAFLLFAASCHPEAGALQYFRPYAGALLVGTSLFSRKPALAGLLQSRPMSYVADVSYALYVWHGILPGTWLGSGDTITRYLKRPLLIGVAFLLSHCTTFYMERPINAFARRITTRKAAIAT